MIGDGLDDPLGTRAAPSRSRRVPGRAILAAGLALAVAGLGFLAVHNDDGRGGEPFAVAAIDRPAPAAAQQVPAKAAEPPAPVVAESGAPSPSAGASAEPTGAIASDSPGQDVQSENGVKVVRAARSAGSTSVVLKVPQAQATALAPAPDPRLSEASATGLLPKVGSDGSRPADVYARPAAAARSKSRIAILIGGMGLDPAETTRAARALPGAVTLGFAPYGPDLDAQVRQARNAGHEVLLQLPMEGFGRSDPNLSHMLTAVPTGNEDRLHWLLGRFVGYAGVGNYLGARLLSDEAALQPLLREIAARGLYFVDDGTSTRSLAGPLAADIGLPAARVDVVIDAKPDPASMLVALRQLETLARERGSAVGMATGLPGTNATIERYTAGLGDGGVTLVPISQIVTAEPRTSARNSTGKAADAP